MVSLKNSIANMEIGYVNSSGQKKLYIQVGNERQYYGTLLASKADKFLEMLNSGMKQEVVTNERNGCNRCDSPS